MSYYGGSVTKLGRDMLASLMTGQTLEFTRVMVGKGTMTGDDPTAMTALVDEVCAGTASVPTLVDNLMKMTIEYRNDLNGGLTEGFNLAEFGLYAKTDTQDEVLFYYASLGDAPQPVNAYKKNRIDIRRFPISIALDLSSDEITVSYNANAFVTAAEMEDTVTRLVQDEVKSVVTAVEFPITILKSGWTAAASSEGGYGYSNTVSTKGLTDDDLPVTSKHFPNVIVSKASLDTSTACELAPIVESGEEVLTFWAKSIPTADISATCMLTLGYLHGDGTGGTYYGMPIATAERLGAVRIGSLIDVTDEGVISSHVMTDSEEDALISDIFG